MPWRSPILVVCSLAASTVTAFTADSPAKHATNETLVQRLDHLIIPKVEFREATFREALDYLLHEAQRLDPKHPGINTTVSLPAPGVPVPRGAGVPGVPPAEGPGPAALPDAPGAAAVPAIPGGVVNPQEPKITISVSKVAFSEALNYITDLANLKWRVESNVVQIVSKNEPDPIRQKTFRILPGLFPKSDEVEQREGAEMRALLVKNPRQFLVACGVALAKENTVGVNDNGTILTAQATDAELGQIAAVLDGLPPNHYYEIGRACASFERTRRKASGIILPLSEFISAPLDVALKKLQSRREPSTTPRPPKRNAV